MLLAYVRPVVGEDGGAEEGAAVTIGRLQSIEHTRETDRLAEAYRVTKRLIQRAFTTITLEQILKATLQQVAQTETGGSIRDFYEFYS